MPAAEIDIDEASVSRLLRDQFSGAEPEAATWPLRFVASGWDNVMFRLGDQLAVRLPRRAAAAQLIANEAQALPVLAPRLPVAVPEPVFVGAADSRFPWPWAVVRWIDGAGVDTLPVDQRGTLVDDLAATLVALHTPASDDAPANPFRGVPLAVRADVVAGRWAMVADLRGTEAAAALRGAWEAGLVAAAWPHAPFWLHGDLHTLNLLHRHGRLAGVVDFGDVTSGDPANDLAIVHLGFAAADRAALRDRLDRAGRYDEAVWLRARAWAASFTSAVICDEVSRASFATTIDTAIDSLSADRP